MTPAIRHGALVRVRIEVPRGAFSKRKADGRVDLRSPLPCPYNYGSVLQTEAPDGDPLDAVVLGPRRAFGDVVEATVRGMVDFVDGGTDDPKLVCAPTDLSRWQRRGVVAFFAVYAGFKRLRARLGLGGDGETASRGWRDLPR